MNNEQGIEQRMEVFGQNNRPFYLVDHGNGEFSLCLPFFLLSGEYEDYGRKPLTPMRGKLEMQ